MHMHEGQIMLHSFPPALATVISREKHAALITLQPNELSCQNLVLNIMHMDDVVNNFIGRAGQK